MTFHDLIAIHRQSLRNPQPNPARRRNRAAPPRRRQIYTDWACI